MIRKSFTIRVLAISFVFLALPILIYSFIFFKNSYVEAISEAKDTLRTEANFRSYNLWNVQPVRHVLLRELIYMMNLSEELLNPEIKKMNRQLSEVVHEGGAFQIYILKMESNNVFKIIATSAPSLLDQDFISYYLMNFILKQGGGTFFRYMYWPSAKRYIPFVYSALPVYAPHSKDIIGAIVSTSDIEQQLNIITDKPSLKKNVKFAVLNVDKIVIAATDPKMIGQYFAPITAEKRKEILVSGQIGFTELAPTPLRVIKNEEPSFFEFIFGGQVQIGFITHAPFGEIYLMSFSPKEAFFADALHHFLWIYFIYALIFVIGGGVVYWLALWISKPLKQLTNKMEEVSKGNLAARFQDEPHGFEINLLGSLFNQTVDDLLQHIQLAEDERVRKETYQREVAIIRQVQNTMLPQSVPEVKGGEIAGIYLPAVDVGGDYFGYRKKRMATGEEVVLIAVVDAAGRGMTSSLYALATRGLFRTYSTLSDDLGYILKMVNNDFTRDAAETGMFVTMMYGKYHEESKIFSYLSCGHPFGFVLREGKEVIKLAHSGMAIGLKEVDTLPIDSIQLREGDIVILFTDGLIEAMNAQQEPFTEQRFIDFALEKKWSSARELIDNFVVRIDAFTHGVPRVEEIIVVVLKILK